MSVFLAVQCDGEMRYGTCPKQIMFSTTDVDLAMASARAARWSTSGGRHLCPECSRLGR